MRGWMPIVSVVLLAVIAVAAGCVEDEGLLGSGGSAGKRSNPTASAKPSPNGSAINGGIG
ncbi:hypothetical protein D3C72_883690 [compost metagenome]